MRKIGDTTKLPSSESILGQPSRHPRLLIEYSTNKDKVDYIYFDENRKVSHVTVSPSSDESKLKEVVKAAYPGLSGSYVFYLSVGQMKHFKIEMKPEPQV